MQEHIWPVCFFNNCRERDHVQHYGAYAFFELRSSGRHTVQAKNLIPGQLCVVGSYSADGGVIFRWYAFTNEALLPDNDQLLRVSSADFSSPRCLPNREQLDRGAMGHYLGPPVTSSVGPYFGGISAAPIFRMPFRHGRRTAREGMSRDRQQVQVSESVRRTLWSKARLFARSLSGTRTTAG